MGKNSLNNFICQLSWLEKLSPTHTHPLKTIREFSKPYELLFSELESLVKCNHKIRVQECYGGRAMSCPWHGRGGGIWGAPFGRHAALRLFHLFLFGFVLFMLFQDIFCSVKFVETIIFGGICFEVSLHGPCSLFWHIKIPLKTN